mgnify:FL=1
MVKKTVKSLLLHTMLLNTYKQNSLTAQTITALIFITLCLSMFYPLNSSVRATATNPTPLSTWLLNAINSWSFSAGGTIISCLLVGVEAIIVVIINERFELCNTKFSLFATVYFLTSLSYAPFATFLPQQLTNIFIGLGIYKIFSTYGWDDAGYKAFDAGLLFGIALLFSFNILAIYVLGLVSLLIFRPYKAREATLLTLGAVTPIIFYFAVHYIISQSYCEITDYLAQWFKYHKKIEINNHDYIYIISTGFFGVAAFFSVLAQRNKMNVLGSKAFLIFIFMQIFTTISVLFVPFIETADLKLNTIPTTFMLVAMFCNMRKGWVSELFFLIFLLTFYALPLLWIIG